MSIAHEKAIKRPEIRTIIQRAKGAGPMSSVSSLARFPWCWTQRLVIPFIAIKTVDLRIYLHSSQLMKESSLSISGGFSS
jgi:hypothetical protein